MTKMYLSSFVSFTRNGVRGTHLVFSKDEISRFHTLYTMLSERKMGV